MMLKDLFYFFIIDTACMFDTKYSTETVYAWIPKLKGEGEGGNRKLLYMDL